MLKYVSISLWRTFWKIYLHSANTLKQWNRTHANLNSRPPKKKKNGKRKTYQTCDASATKLDNKTPNHEKHEKRKKRQLKPNQIEWQSRWYNESQLGQRTHWTALLSQVLLVRYNTIEASALCNCIFLAQYPSLYFRFNCHGHRTKAHVSTRTHPGQGYRYSALYTHTQIAFYWVSLCVP